MVAGGVIVPAVLAVVLPGIDLRPIGEPTVRRGVGELPLGPTFLTAADAGRAVGRLDNPVVDVRQSCIPPHSNRDRGWCSCSSHRSIFRRLMSGPKAR